MDLDNLCGKRFENSEGRDVCVLPRGHEDHCENNRGQRLPVQVVIPRLRCKDPSCDLCNEGVFIPEKHA